MFKTTCIRIRGAGLVEQGESVNDGPTRSPSFFAEMLIA